MLKHLVIASLAGTLGLTAAIAQDHAGHETPAPQTAAHDHGAKPAADQGGAQVPSSLVAEHHKIHNDLAAAIAAGGKTGEAAKHVEELLAAHFAKEEKHAMKPLGLLVPLARGEKISAEVAKQVIADTEVLRKEYDQMLKEHGEIRRAVRVLRAAAQDEKQSAAIAFADALALHAQNEEQVLYPAALLVGDRLASQHAGH